MIIRTGLGVYSHKLIKKNPLIQLRSNYSSGSRQLDLSGSISYPPLVNSHDHLIGNWYPRALDNAPYSNAHDWVNEFKSFDSINERNKIWVNDVPMRFDHPRARLLISLGIYKNIFSGVGIVQDHSPKQSRDFYNTFPIKIVENYEQCHSIALGDFWNGKKSPGICQAKIQDLQEQSYDTPFIIHLGEGVDDIAKNEFKVLAELQLLRSNTMLIHGIALTEEEIKKCAGEGTSLCWCPQSNFNLIGKTLDIESCLKHGTNVVLGTDSTLSGSDNLFRELRFAHSKFPHIPSVELFKMVTDNPAKALMFSKGEVELNDESENILILPAITEDPFDNLLTVDNRDIILFVYRGLPLYGNKEILENFDVDISSYFFFETGGQKKFVFGHPESLTSEISNILGYSKNFLYLPFQC